MTTQQNTTFPQEVEVTFKIKFLVPTQEDKNSILDSVTNTASPELVADLFDILLTEGCDNIVSINDLTSTQVRDTLQKSINELP